MLSTQVIWLLTLKKENKMQKTQAGTTQTVSRKEITKVDQLTSASEDKYRNTHY